MIIVVDGYNVLKQLTLGKHVSETQRVQFINQLSRYAKGKGHKIVLVFDGGEHDWPTKEKIGAGELIYSGVNRSADDYIRYYLKQHRAKDLLLVSSDLELNRRADTLSIPSIDSDYFYQLMLEALNEGIADVPSLSSVVKLAEDTDPDLDVLMYEASATVSTKSEDIASVRDDRSSMAKTLSKHDRMLRKKLKKL